MPRTRSVKSSSRNLRIMGSQKPLRLKGLSFGPLKVIQLWGSQSGNLAWVYHCRNCGHVGKRLGVTLRRTEQKCPKCKYYKQRPDRGAWPFPRPNMEAVDALMAEVPAKTRIKPPGLSRRLSNCTTAELNDLLDRVEAELEKRIKCELSSPSGACNIEMAGAPPTQADVPVRQPGAIEPVADTTSPCERDLGAESPTAQSALRS